jgi:uncharacterized LabA/DUF88 family protein
MSETSPSLATPILRVHAFFDGQNLSHAAGEAFGHRYPLYDPQKLAESICQRKGWKLVKTHLYTGIHRIDKQPFWHYYWASKKQGMMRRGVDCQTREVNYRTKEVDLVDGRRAKAYVAEEKGIDVKLASDLITLAYENAYDVGLIFSQDQDLIPAVEAVKRVSEREGRKIVLACAYPVGPKTLNRLGIRGSTWVEIGGEEYESCLDTYDHAEYANRMLKRMPRR